MADNHSRDPFHNRRPRRPGQVSPPQHSFAHPDPRLKRPEQAAQATTGEVNDPGDKTLVKRAAGAGLAVLAVMALVHELPKIVGGSTKPAKTPTSRLTEAQIKKLPTSEVQVQSGWGPGNVVDAVDPGLLKAEPALASAVERVVDRKYAVDHVADPAQAILPEGIIIKVPQVLPYAEDRQK